MKHLNKSIMKTRENITAFALLALALACNSQVSGQNKNTDTNFYNEKVIVLGSYDPTLKNSDKINVAPTIVDTATMTPEYNYSIESQRIYTLYSPDAIKPARVVGEPASRLYRNYLKLGFGNYCTPFADLYYNSTRNKTLNYGARVYHKSSWWTLKDYGKDYFSNTVVDVFGKKIWTKNTLSANVFYTHDYNLYYGFPDSLFTKLYPAESELQTSDYSQYYHNFGLKAQFKSNNTDVNQLGYEANFALTDLADKYSSNEFNISLNADAHYGFAFWGTEKQMAGLKINLDYFKNSGDTTLFPMSNLAPLDPNAATNSHSGSSVLFGAQPYFSFKAFGFKMNVGLNLAYANNEDKGFKIFPNIDLSQTLFNDILHLTFGLHGDYIHHSWQSLRMENPYIAPRCEIRNSTYNQLFAEMKFNFTKKFDTRVGASYTLYKNLNFFMLDTFYSLNNVYKTVYNDVNILNINADIVYHYDEKISVGVRGDFFNYNLKGDGLTEAWYRPTWDAYLNVAYNLNNKFYARLEGGFIGNRKAQNRIGSQWVDEDIKLKYGVNIDLEYRYSRALSFFADINNVACQRYFIWTNYPSQRINFILGATYTIPVK